jgi:PAS domain S-box-containing protein
MIKHFLRSNIAFVGGGKFCKAILELFYSKLFEDHRPSILGVADINFRAEGLLYAIEKGIFTFHDYRELFHLENLQVLIELTWDVRLADIIRKTKPPTVKLIDHIEARAMWSSLQFEKEKRRALKEIRQKKYGPEELDILFEQFADRLGEVIEKRYRRYIEIEKELSESERTMSQIVQGSTIPTFVINKDHIVTHWNKACEKLTGYSAAELVGTNKQWVPFRPKKRPIMADLILDQVKEEDVWRYYGTKWQKSLLIEGAYGAEEFFPHLGQEGKWLFFTAAPIKGPDGTLVGAIETLWDKTADKEAEEERERHTREQSTLVSIYTALNAPFDIRERVHSAIQVVGDFLTADGVCIFLMESDGKYHMNYSYGVSEKACQLNSIIDKNSLIHRAAQTGELTVYEDLPEDCIDEICFLEEEKLKSLAYIPISTEEKQQFGVVRIGSKKPEQFFYQHRDILELICNRIGVTIQNAMLQEQYIQSEEKYRSLFNNDPNPIFIIDSKTYEILDTNQRAQDCYGYSQEELVGLSFLDLGDETDEEIAQSLRILTEDQSVLLAKKRHYKKRRRPFYVNINVSYAEYSGSNVLIATTTDITESIEKETQLIQAGKMTTLGVMAAGMAHEINQPLNVIQVCADFFLKMLKKGQPVGDDDLRTMANDIVANVDRAAGVIKHVRDFARQSEVVRSRVSINDPIKDVFKVLGNQLKVHQIEVELDLDPSIPSIMAEHNRLEQVFINLVTNAIDALDEKSSQPDFRKAEKRLSIKTFVENGHVVVNVSDTGIGMSKEVQSKIFEPFFTTKKIGKGTGLGVSISYGIVKDYNGNIELESEVGKGTTFKLSFNAVMENAAKHE